jgi:putative ABC transport system ATP-binding protein
MEPVIKLENFVKTYRAGEVDIPAVRGVTLSIMPGEFVAIMGASGSGKSTMMNSIGCLDRPSSGRYILDGIDVNSLDRDELADYRNKKLGFVFQGFNLLSRTSAIENVELPLLYSRPAISSREQRDRALKSLKLVGLGERTHHHPNQLSGGQQQRVAIARALVNDPRLLLADEPTGNLDTLTSVEIMMIFQELNRSGMTIVMVTHEPDVARYCLRQVVMRDGRVVSDLPVTDRLDAARELEKIKQEHQAIQLAQ